MAVELVVPIRLDELAGEVVLFNGVKRKEPKRDEPVGVVVKFDNPIGKDEFEEGLFGVLTPGDDPEGEEPEGEVPNGEDLEGEVFDDEESDGEEADGDEEGDDELVLKRG